MNTGFYKDLDTNFEAAFELSEKEYSQDELIELLKNGNIPQKQIAALKLETLRNTDEAEILIGNLTGCDGKIREAVALKINELLRQDSKYINYFSAFPEFFAAATIDINGNICRLAADSACILKPDFNFGQGYVKKIKEYIYEAFAALDKFIYKDKKYVINKQLFKLYWCLEALKNYYDMVPESELKEILSRTVGEREYTIREKTAQILYELKAGAFNDLTERLKNDENYYVRAAFWQNVKKK